MLNDLRYALRMLMKSPGFTAVAVISLALGIGANTAVFSILNAILVRSLPVPNPHELRIVNWTGNDISLSGLTGSVDDEDGRSISGTFSAATFRDFRNRAAGMADVFAFFPIHNLAMQARTDVGVSHAMMVSGNYFGGYGARTTIGRMLTPDDDQANADPAAVITYRFWKRRFDLDPAALGQTLGINGHRFTIVGVLSQDYVGPMMGDSADVYVPLAAQPQLQPGWPLASYDQWWVLMMARLAPGISDAQLQGALAVSFAQTLEQSRTRMKQADIVLKDGRQGIVMERRNVARSLYALQGIVATVLLIACANLAGLMIARATARRREFAVCSALGASRWRLMRQPLVESSLLALLGAAIGLLCDSWIKHLLLGFLPDLGFELHLDTRTDGRVLLVTLAAALVTALLCGLLPSWRASRTDPMVDLKGGRTGDPARRPLGRVLVAMQVALSLLLVAGCGLFLRSMGNLRGIDLGFNPENLLLFRLDADQAGYSEQRRGEFFARVRDGLAHIPGVKAAASSHQRLLTGYMSSTGFSIPGRQRRPDEQWQTLVITISDGYFETMGIPVRQGRDFSASDIQAGQPVIIINDQFASRHFPAEDPIGRTVRVYGVDYRIVGVCGSTVYTDLKRAKPVTIYLSSRQRIPDAMHFAVRSVLPPESIVPAIRQAVAAVDASIPLAEVSTQDAQIEASLYLERLFVSLCGSLGGLAVALSCIGLYGLLAHNVARRKAEIGLRMALGARPVDVAREIVREALTMTLVGCALGLPLAVGLGFAGRAAFYAVAPYDPISMLAAVLALIGAATLAAWIPALRAARVDPMIALRSE